MSRPKDPKAFGHRAGGSNRTGSTRDLHHQTRQRNTTTFTCDLCPFGTAPWSVGREQSVVTAQSAHRAAHTLALRMAVEAIVAEHAGTYAQSLR